MNLQKAQEIVAEAIKNNASELDFDSYNDDEKLSDGDFEILLPEILKVESLTGLDLMNNEISDYSFLESLTTLTSLDLSNNEISDISFLESLTSLTNLYLRNNEISDISFLESLTTLKSLDLRNNEISDISFLESLTTLKSLDLSNNEISDISFLESLTTLTSLDLSNNEISDYSFLESLTSLTNLDLMNNEISDISFLESLTTLTSLDLRNNEISDYSFLESLTSLTNLDLRNNEISDISFLESLTSLTNLDLRNNEISDISFLESLTSLTNLDLMNNEISDISFLENLTTLTNLYLSNNEISDISFLESLTSLKSLFLMNTQISDISFLESLTSLTNLDLMNNEISDISFLEGLTSLKYLYLRGNSKLNLPKELKDQFTLNRKDVDKIISFYRQIEEEGKDYIYEAKVLIVGEPKAGKTTLFKKLQDSTYNPLEATQEEKESTIGVDINILEFPFDENTTFKAHLWDFGGNEKQYVLHQYFFTERSLYLLLADDRKEAANFNYWFEVIAAFGIACPVLVVLNEINSKVKNLDISIYRNEFGEKIKDIEEKSVNFAIDDGRFKNLANEIETKLKNLDHIGKALPKTWVEIRKKLREVKEPLISIDDYYQICEESGVENPEYRKQILEYLHDLGIALNYKYDDNLRNKLILKPNWVIDALYAVLKDEDINENAGRFSSEDVDKLWTTYNADERTILLQLMQKGKFEVAYKLENKNEYIAPILLPEITPKYTFDATDNLEIHFEYKFKPKGIISRLIVRFHEDIYEYDDNQVVWKKGVLLEYKNSIAQVIESEQFKKITVKVSGKNPTQNRQFITVIRTALKSIHRDWFEDRLDFEEKVPCICDVCQETSKPHFYELETVESYYEMNAEIVCDKSMKAKRPQRVNARRLLEGVYIEDTAREIREFASDKFNIAQLIIVNGNISKVTQGSQDIHLRIEKIENVINEVSPKMDETQKQAMEELADKLIARIKEEGGVFFNQEKLEEYEEAKKGKWETKIKFSLPLIPLEFSRKIPPDEFISKVRKYVYGDDFQLNILQAEEEETNRLLGQ